MRPPGSWANTSNRHALHMGRKIPARAPIACRWRPKLRVSHRGRRAPRLRGAAGRTYASCPAPPRVSVPVCFSGGQLGTQSATTGVAARKTGPGPNICVLVQFSISYTRSLYNSTFSCGLWTFANLALRELASTSHFLSPIGSSSLSSEAPAADGTAARPPAGRA